MSEPWQGWEQPCGCFTDRSAHTAPDKLLVGIVALGDLAGKATESVLEKGKAFRTSLISGLNLGDRGSRSRDTS